MLWVTITFLKHIHINIKLKITKHVDLLKFNQSHRKHDHFDSIQLDFD